MLFVFGVIRVHVHLEMSPGCVLCGAIQTIELYNCTYFKFRRKESTCTVLPQLLSNRNATRTKKISEAENMLKQKSVRR